MIHYWDRKKERDVKIHSLYNQTNDLEIVSKQFGVSYRCAMEALKKLGVRFPKKKLHKKSACNSNRDLVIKMESDGYSLSEIGRKIGTTARSIKRWMIYNNIQHDFSKMPKGERHSLWKGGRQVDKDGYCLLYFPDHPHRRKHTPYVLEHRIVMEKMIGRYLDPKEVVHHKDGNKQNNSPHNLQLFSENREHLAHELKGRVPKWTPEGLENMKKGIARSAVLRRERILAESKRDAASCI